MRPQGLKTKIFLDSGDPAETCAALGCLGFLDGQTTNPSLIAKHPDVQARLARGEKFKRAEVLEFYHGVIARIGGLIPNGSVSVEVYADRATTVEVMLREAEQMFAWIPNAHVKLPITRAGLAAAARAVRRGVRVNVTLCFTQAQAAAVHACTRGAQRGSVLVSPFVGRIDDRGIDGISLIRNILSMYRQAGSHVEVCVASVRTLAHLLAAVALGADIVTAPLGVLKSWVESGMQVFGSEYEYDAGGRTALAPLTIDLREPIERDNDWLLEMLPNELTTIGVDRFAADWNALIG